jgi:DNA-binding transcriptional LysR family regulator
METIKGLEEFILVAQYESFSNAALELRVSKSHISKQITRLEDSLQVRLFNRTTRKITLTEAGKTLYGKSKNLLSDLSLIYEEVSQSQKEPKGTIRISVAGAFAEDHLSKCFSEFLKKYRNVGIEVVFNDKFVDLIEDGFDLAIRYGELQSSSLISKKIASRQEFICATPEYLLSNGTPTTPKDLENHNCLIGQTDRWIFKTKQKNKSIRVKGTWRSNNPRATATAACSGLGIAKLPGAYVIDALKHKKLIALLEDHTEKEQNIWILYPQKNYLPQKVRVLIDFLTIYFEKNYDGVVF